MNLVRIQWRPDGVRDADEMIFSHFPCVFAHISFTFYLGQILSKILFSLLPSYFLDRFHGLFFFYRCYRRRRLPILSQKKITN